MPIDLMKLTSDLSAAKQLAEVAVKRDPRDGGSCNRDSVSLNFERLPPPSTRKKIEEAVQGIGLSCFWFRQWGVHLLVSPSVPGQAALNTLAVDTMVGHLKKEGWNVHTSHFTD